MNIKLVKEGDRWFIVVNSLAGEFREDVTAAVEGELRSEVHQRAIKAEGDARATRYAQMEEVIGDVVQAVSPFVDA